MKNKTLWTLIRLTIVIGAACLVLPQASAQVTSKQVTDSSPGCTYKGKFHKNCPPSLLKQIKREEARRNAPDQKVKVRKNFAGVSTDWAAKSPLAGPALTPKVMTLGAPLSAPAAPVMAPGTTPDYFGVANYANSAFPEVCTGPGVPIGACTAAGQIIPGTGLRKFVDTLPGLCAVPSGTNNLGQCIPLAGADTTTFPGSDFYRIGLREYQKQMHSDLPAGTLATRLRGYVQLDSGNAPVGANQYLGLLILATRNRPVRVLFKNMLTSDLPLPTDTTYMGAGSVSGGGSTAMASKKRATLHLHGGNPPWISDGTTHQWITPAGGDGQPNALGFSKGYSFMDVPDMAGPGCVAALGAGCPNPTPNLKDGAQTFFWTNQQSGRLLFYHDHAYGMTRLNVYGGEAAGYLLVDPAQETALKTATSPGTIVTNPSTGAIVTADLTHLVPLVIQDKTFVPDSATNPAGQLAMQDPTWDVNAWGGAGNLWYPHVYMPNQNPADITGSSGFGRWDWGPWFWPPQNPASLTLPPFVCNSIATPAGGWMFPPLMCPGVPDPTRPAPGNSPSGVPEGFMDTMVVNGTAYPSLTVDPTAYRFHVLNASNDRAINLGLYVAEPLSVSITTGGAGYANPTTAAITGCSAIPTTTVNVLAGAVDSITAVLPAGATCTNPQVTITGAGTGAAAIASTNTEVKMVLAAPAGLRTTPDCSTVLPMAGGGQISALQSASGALLNGPTGLPAGCWPQYNSLFFGPLSWPTDMREGGVPDPLMAGPPIIQIGTEGGLLPKPVVIPSTPVSYDYNKRSITVLNVLNHGLYVGTAERADVIVDFSAFAGKTLILYNDAPAPVPASDPRVDYYTNGPDNSATGGALTTMAGYGPNTRTVMQIKVNAGTPSTAFNLATLTTNLPGIFAATQDKVIVPEPDYPATNGNGLASYSRIFDTSLKVNSPSPTCSIPPCMQPMLPKTIQELFTLDYGRMNATLGVELPFTNFLTQTTIPYGYSDPPTEMFKDGETQIWKITHNGVDTHYIHFHLFTVQVINRVGWDGAIKPPDPTELSFKDTVRMNPLEDIIVALRPFKQDFSSVPWGNKIPNSYRPIDVTMNVGATSATVFTNLDPANNPAAVVNDVINFGWEYVWHCHILGHEENDMMRAMILAVAPDVPVLSGSASGTGVNLTWTEGSANYTGFTIQRTTDPAFLTGITTIVVGPTPLAYLDSTTPTAQVYYRIQANNLVGYTRTYAAPAVGYPHQSADSVFSNVITIANPAVSPTALTFNSPVNVTSAGQTVTVKNNRTTAVTGLSIVLGGTNANQFARTLSGCPATLAANATCTVTVTFRPTSAAPAVKTALLNINVTGGGVSQSVALTGNVVIVYPTVTPTALTFSSPLNVTSAGQTVTVTNNGTTAVAGLATTITGTNANQFARTTACTATLAAGASCTINVTFRPTAATPTTKVATLNINVTAPATSATVALTGNVVSSYPTIAPTTLTFSSNLNVASAAQTVTVTNNGTTAVAGLATTITGTNANQFARTTACGATLAAGASCTINVTFLPTAATPTTKVATLNINVTAPATSATVALTGNVTTTVLPSGLIAAYGLNAGTGTTVADSSGNGITGTITGATWTTAGQYGNALSFNGSTNFVNLGNPAVLAITGSMTWAAWVRPSTTPVNDGQIIAKSDGTNGWEFKTSPDTGQHRFAVAITSAAGVFVQRNSATVRTLGTMYHVAAVYNATARTLDIYVNGVLNNGVLTGTVPAARTVPNINVNIGRRTGGYYFPGVIDEVMVFNRALSLAEIQTVKNTPLP